MSRSYLDKDYKSLDHAFIALSRRLTSIETSCPSKGCFLSAPRGQEIKELLAVTFALSDPRHRVLGVAARKFSTEYLAAELVWYFSGHNQCDWIERHASFWSSIKNEDGSLNSAYGDRIFNRGLLEGGAHVTTGKLKRNQWKMVLDELRKDPDSRRAVIHIRTIDDGFDAKDVPCTLSLQFLLREGRLDLIVHMRSNDLVLGACYDVPAFTIMQEVMANDLGVELGYYYHIANSLHIYSRHYEMAQKAASEDFHCYRTSNGSKNVAMLPLERQATIDAIRNWAGVLYRMDEVELEGYVKGGHSPAVIERGISNAYKRVVDSCDIRLVRDMARLLASSALKRSAKANPSWSDELNGYRNLILQEIEDPSLGACTR